MSNLESDVLVIGGGMAAAWAAIGAARAGASVVLVDKGYFGTSGVTATAGPGHWWVPPEPALRAAAIRQREAIAFGLAEPRWMGRILDETWRQLPTLAGFYEFGANEQGVTLYGAVRGPEYLRALRQLARQLGVHIFDHSPALELLMHADGSAAGARGLHRQLNQSWSARAAGVILATGGCAFFSRLLGSRTNTGDGYLMAAEAGVDLSGMEFTSQYIVAPAFSTMGRGMSYVYATYYDAAGRILDVPVLGDSTRALARHLIQGPVYCDLARMPQDIRERLPYISPNVMLPFARNGIDPFRDKFPITLLAEGTIRGLGGIRITDDDCQTSVPGLFAAGDAATRELVAGASSGGGSVNSAWALSSGYWAGQAAARRARLCGVRTDSTAEAVGYAGLRPRRTTVEMDTGALIAAARSEATDYDKNLFRSGDKLEASLQVLDGLWNTLRDGLDAGRQDALRAREAAAIVASARWSYTAALHRHESRGQHQRVDLPQAAPQFARRQIVSGLDHIRSNFSGEPQAAEAAA
jgi:succinate dehydrogenase/fumarate reductase flavoprotein subunit